MICVEEEEDMSLFADTETQDGERKMDNLTQRKPLVRRPSVDVGQRMFITLFLLCTDLLQVESIV